MNNRALSAAVGSTVLLAACGGNADPAGDKLSDAAHDGIAAPASFAQCSTCHAVEPGRNGLGPSLAGIHGAQAAAVEGFAYSPALRASGIVWDDAALDAYLENPHAHVPGTRMVYAGLRDPAARAEVIDYLKTI